MIKYGKNNGQYFFKITVALVTNFYKYHHNLISLDTKYYSSTIPTGRSPHQNHQLGYIYIYISNFKIPEMTNMNVDWNNLPMEVKLHLPQPWNLLP